MNPTCSDEGIASNFNIKLVPSTTDILTLPVKMDISVDTNDLMHYISQSLKNNSVQISSKNELRDIEICKKLTLNKNSNNLSFNQMNNHLYQFFNTNYTNSILHKSDEKAFLNILNKYKIRIPNYNNNSITKQKKRKKVKKSFTHRMNKKRKNKYSSKKLSSKKQPTSCTRYCSHFVTKLLILNLYLKYLEKERYTKYISKI